MQKAGAFSDHLTIPSWDDLRFALALAREGSIRKAARGLGVSHSTVLRRIESLETATGVRLFDRGPARWELTPAGQDVFDTAQELEGLVVGLERRVEGRDLRLVGPVRVTLPDPLLPVLAPDLAALARAHPGIELTIAVSTQFKDLSHRQADIAIRIAPDPPADLVGRRFAPVACGIYGAPGYLKGKDTRDLEALEWVSWARESSMVFARWVDANVPNARITVRVDTSWALREAVDAEAGVALLPCALGVVRGWKLVRMVPELTAPLWVLTHADLRAMTRVRVCRDFLGEVLTKKRALWEGKKR